MTSYPLLVPALLAFLAGMAGTIFLSRSRATLVMGGIAILIAVIAASWAAGILPQVRYLLLAMALLFAAGLWSDVSDRADLGNLAVQVIATTLIVGVSGAQLGSIPTFLALPLTVFALLAVAHSVSMMDGLRGFRAAFAFVALAWFTAAAAVTGQQVQFQIGLMLAGAIGGYLVSNLALMKRPYARVLLGTAGGLMIGFTLGWLALDITRPRFGFSASAVLWILMLPLAEGLSAILRRKALGRPVFARDDQQIHDYLMAKGYTQGDALVMLITAAALLGGIGYAGWRLHVPEIAMYALAAVAFAAYHGWMTRNWRRITGFTVMVI